MEYEYRYLSEEKAAELDAKGLVNNLGKKININSIKSVVNNDETVIFRQIWFSHEQDDPDVHIFVYNDWYYFIDIFRVKVWGKITDNSKCWCFKYDIVDIHSTISNAQEYSLDELLKELKKVLYINSEHIGRKKVGDKTEIVVMYKGKELCSRDSI